MVWAGVTYHGEKLPLVFIQGGLDNAKYRQMVLYRTLKPWVEGRYGGTAGVIFQQDGAPSHTANATQSYLKEQSIP